LSRAATACTGSAFTWATTACTGSAFTWACWSVTLLPLEKFLHLFATGPLTFIEFAILVLVKLFKKQFTNILLLSLRIQFTGKETAK
jgi:hypothetical protein